MSRPLYFSKSTRGKDEGTHGGMSCEVISFISKFLTAVNLFIDYNFRVGFENNSFNVLICFWPRNFSFKTQLLVKS